MLSMSDDMLEMNAREMKAIEQNFEKYKNMCAAVGGRSEQLLGMLDVLGDRLAVCPASSKLGFHNAFPGGLVEHSLRVLAYAKKLSDTMNLKLDRGSLIICCLMHDLGKVGELEEERYVPQDSDWHYKRGNVYRINESLVFQSVADATTFLLQHFDVKLTDDEYVAIRTADGMYEEANRPYGMRQSDLAVVVHHADLWATRYEKKHPRKSLVEDLA